MKLYSYQEECVKFHLSKSYSLCLLEQGLGKTIVALETAKRFGSAPLIIGPAFLEMTWRNESLKVGVPISGFLSYAMLHKTAPDIFKASPIWIFDEAHYLQSPAAIRTNSALDALRTFKPRKAIFMSGTPIRSRIPNIWTLLMACSLDGTPENALPPGLRYHRKFSRYFCDVEEMRVHGRLVEKYKDLKPNRVEEFRSLLRPKAIRFLAADVLKDLPPIIRKEVAIPTTEAPDGLEQVFHEYLKGKKVDSSAKRLSAVLKVPATVEYCRSLMESGAGKLVVFTDHIEPAQDIAAKIGPRAVAITGGTPAWERHSIVNEFQRPDSRYMVIVATIGSMSVGWTLTAAKNIIFNDKSWIPSENAQAERRIHRIGQKQICIIHTIISTPTDRYIDRILLEKMETIGKAIT